MEIEIDHLQVARPTEIFTHPLIAEVVGASFDRPPNTRNFTVRFPRVVKIHHDRQVEDVLDLVEYQKRADQSQACTTDEDDQVKEAWLTKLAYPAYNHRLVRETSSPDSIGSDQNAITVPHSTPASKQANNKNKRTLLEGNDATMLPVEQKVRLNVEPLTLSGDSHLGSSQQDQRSSTIENSPRLKHQSRCRRMGNTINSQIRKTTNTNEYRR